mgnify:CR=1 FL=1
MSMPKTKTARASTAPYPTKVEWQVPLGRHVPFGYKQDEDDPDLLLPITEELELLEKAKLFLQEYSLRQVAGWLTKQSGRYISHVGLDKRVRIEEKRRRASSSYRKYAKKYKEASRKAEKIEKQRLGGRATKRVFGDNWSDTEEPDTDE